MEAKYVWKRKLINFRLPIGLFLGSIFLTFQKKWKSEVLPCSDENEKLEANQEVESGSWKKSREKEVWHQDGMSTGGMAQQFKVFEKLKLS